MPSSKEQTPEKKPEMQRSRTKVDDVTDKTKSTNDSHDKHMKHLKMLMKQKTQQKRERPKGHESITSYLADERHKEEHWSKVRIVLDKALSSIWADVLVGLLVIINIFVLVLQVDSEAAGAEQAVWLAMIDTALSIIYMLELIGRVYVHRLDMLTHPRDLADAAIVIGDICVMAFGGISALSILRLIRLTRLVRAIEFLILFPELHLMIKGLISATRAIFWGLALVIATMVVWSILAVQLVHPIVQQLAAEGVYEGCERCPRAFGSVAQSVLTFTQTLIAGDSWGILATPVIEHSPPLYGFFFMSLASVSIVVLNLILGVIVDQSLEARRHADHEIVKIREKILEAAKERLMQLCVMLDKDCTGTLTCEELEEGFQTNEDFADCMLAMDVEDKDLDMVFQILDKDASGEVDYAEFVQEMQDLRSNNAHTLLVFIKQYVKSLHDHFLAQFSAMQENQKKMLNELNEGIDNQKRMLNEIDQIGTEVEEEAARGPQTVEEVLRVGSLGAAAAGKGAAAPQTQPRQKDAPTRRGQPWQSDRATSSPFVSVEVETLRISLGQDLVELRNRMQEFLAATTADALRMVDQSQLVPRADAKLPAARPLPTWADGNERSRWSQRDPSPLAGAITIDGSPLSPKEPLG